MRVSHYFTSARFKNFKAFKTYSISLKEFNVLVGPNNSGKSTILGAFRILSEALRKANSKRAEIIRVLGRNTWGYSVSLEDLPVATENVFTDYNDEEPAVIDFRISNGNILKLVFPEVNRCCLVCETTGKPVKSPSEFKREYAVSVGFVPVLGPVEHKELLYQKEAARLALLSYHASRNFRNIWHHYPDNFDEFRGYINTTWPGMDIKRPEIDYRSGKPCLYMFCPEDRILREIFWAGFGFQVWCQMLTHIVKSKNDTLLIIDEPDIYLHSDLQRQLVHILKTIGPDILIATHSTEIISEAEPDDLLIINKRFMSAKRITDPIQIRGVFEALGSSLNPTLTQLAKSRRAVFVEGKDFQLLSLFSRRLGRNQIANRSDFAVIPLEGFNPAKVIDLCRGIEMTLGTKIMKGVIFDRDYRSVDEVKAVIQYLTKNTCSLAWIHNRKEIENYLLEPLPLERAIQRRIDECNRRNNSKLHYDDNVRDLLIALSDAMRTNVNGQYLSKRVPYEKSINPGLDYATINQAVLTEFDATWSTLEGRLIIVPGKELLSLLNKYLQDKYGLSLTIRFIIEAFTKEEIPRDIVDLINRLEDLRKA
jgi:energy-coupling factor transporter ATP-binding protein EcfA2